MNVTLSLSHTHTQEKKKLFWKTKLYHLFTQLTICFLFPFLSLFLLSSLFMILFTVFYYWMMLKILQILLLLSYIYISIIACHHHKKSFQTFNNYVPVWIQIIVASAFLLCGFFFFLFFQPAFVDFSTLNSASVYCSQTHKFHFSATFSLKMGHTALFTHLKIILLQCF